MLNLNLYSRCCCCWCVDWWCQFNWGWPGIEVNWWWWKADQEILSKVQSSLTLFWWTTWWWSCKLSFSLLNFATNFACYEWELFFVTCISKRVLIVVGTADFKKFKVHFFFLLLLHPRLLLLCFVFGADNLSAIDREKINFHLCSVNFKISNTLAAAATAAITTDDLSFTVRYF